MRTLSSFQKRTVVTQSGQVLGRCHDLRGEFEGSKLRVTGLCVGRTAWLAHLGIRLPGQRTVVPWSAVIRIEGKRIVVRDEVTLAGQSLTP
jgi:sporulation protein YlmC with PRC-barrel domain